MERYAIPQRDIRDDSSYRYLERRRFVRVPVSGPMHWRSGADRGLCEAIDISPGGASFRLPIRQAAQIGPTVSLDVDLGVGLEWDVTRDARVVRRTTSANGQCILGVEFPPHEWQDVAAPQA